MTTKAFQSYIELVLKLREVPNDSPEADALRDEMDRHWYDLTHTEIALVKELGEALSSPEAWDGDQPKHDTFDFTEEEPPPYLILRSGETSVAFAIPVKWQPGNGRGETFSSTSGRLDWETQILAAMADEIAAWVEEKRIFQKMLAVISGIPPGTSVSGDIVDWGDE